MNENCIYKTSEDFALQIVRLYKYLMFEKKEFVLSKQILRSGTSLGANVSEQKYSAALKDANETKYWIKLLLKSGFISESEVQEIKDQLVQIIKSLTARINSLKEKKNLL